MSVLGHDRFGKALRRGDLVLFLAQPEDTSVFQGTVDRMIPRGTWVTLTSLGREGYTPIDALVVVDPEGRTFLALGPDLLKVEPDEDAPERIMEEDLADIIREGMRRVLLKAVEEGG